GRRTRRSALHPTRRAMEERLHRIVQRPRPRRMPEHQRLLVFGPSPGRHQRLEGRLQPTKEALRAELPGASGLRCNLQPPMINSHPRWISYRGPTNGVWADLLWEYEKSSGSDFIIDDEFMRYLTFIID